MAWFQLNGDERLGRCATESCWGQPTWRLEADGVGSNYCSACQQKIEMVAGGYTDLPPLNDSKRQSR